jgi:rod shape determining protein RodA
VTIQYKNLDWKLIGAATALSLIGIFIIYAAGYYEQSEFRQSFYERQMTWFLLALAVFAVIIHIPFRFFDFGAYPFYGLALVLLFLVLVLGDTRLGATRWFSFGGVSFAPADLGKLALICTLARFFSYTRLPVTSKRRLALSFILTAIPVALILKQPDLGTSLVFWAVLILMWLWSGLSPMLLLLLLSPVVSLITATHWLAWAIYIVVLLVVVFAYRPGLAFGVVIVIANLAFGSFLPFIWNRLADYQKMRILVFLDPGMDPRGAGYQIIQSKIAIGSGGVLGKGFLEGSQSKLDFLPERHTDFIFSVLGEEFGLWGALVVVGIFAFLFYRCILIATRCRSPFASNIVMGAMAVILFQFLVNVGMTLGMMPVTGLPLPFLSYGGTSLVMFWILIGLIVSAEYRWQEY